MIIYDQNGNTIENPDMSKGRIIEHSIPVWHIWDGNGWSGTVDEDDKPVPYGEVTIPIRSEENPDGTNPAEFDNRVPDWWLYGVYTPYTAEELAAQEEERQREEARQRANELLPDMPDIIDDQDAAIVELYEGMMQMQLETDEALTALYESLL